MPLLPAALIFAPSLVDSSIVVSLSRSERAFLETLRGWLTLDARHARALVRAVPPVLRGLAWRQLAGSIPLEQPNADLYARYAASSTTYDDAIAKDIHRTLPGAPTELHASLHRVLHAYAVMHPDLGYCQGMSYVVALVLETVGGECEAFWLFSQVMAQHALSGLWTDGLPLLRLCLYCLDRMIGMRFPKLFSHLKSLNVTPLLFASQWFTSCFTYNFPRPLAARVWDVFLAEGLAWLFKVALAVLRIHHEKLLGLAFEPLLEFIKDAPPRLDPDQVIRAADSMDFVTADLVVSFKKEFTHPSMSQARSYF
jgi:hypothetical protein